MPELIDRQRRSRDHTLCVSRISCLSTLLLLALGAVGCGESQPLSDHDAALFSVKRDITADLGVLVTEVTAMRAALPPPDADGWNAAADRAAVTAMRQHWFLARAAYERIEGAVAILFPEGDYEIDARYDGFLANLPGHRDDDLFDGEGVTGMHAVERILWADEHPPVVLAFERGQPGYVPAAFPSTEAEATRFRDGLMARLVRDVTRMRDGFAPLALDPSSAFRGVIGSMREQAEKVDNAASGEEESRYARATLLDMRSNLTGASRTWLAFRPWVLSRGGVALAQRVDQKLTALRAQYDLPTGNSIPPVPEGYDPDMPSQSDRQTPFGALRDFVHSETDASLDGSLVFEMNAAADLLGIARLRE